MDSTFSFTRNFLFCFLPLNLLLHLELLSLSNHFTSFFVQQGKLNKYFKNQIFSTYIKTFFEHRFIKKSAFFVISTPILFRPSEVKKFVVIKPLFAFFMRRFSIFTTSYVIRRTEVEL